VTTYKWATRKKGGFVPGKKSDASGVVVELANAMIFEGVATFCPFVSSFSQRKRVIMKTIDDDDYRQLISWRDDQIRQVEIEICSTEIKLEQLQSELAEKKTYLSNLKLIGEAFEDDSL
jgi:hypothetical protein